MKEDRRIANMDLERVFLILMVIVLHYNNRDMGGALNLISQGFGASVFVRLTQSLSICAVDAFIICSGYLSARRLLSSDQDKKADALPWRKALWLLVTCSFYRVTGYLIYALFITGDFSIRLLFGYMVPNNWFVGLFVTLLLLSPFLNRALEGCNAKLFSGILIVLFSVVPTLVSFAGELAGINIQGLSTVTWAGDGNGFNIAIFITCYCTGYGLYVCRDYLNRFSDFFFLTMYALGALLTAALSVLTERAWEYSCVSVLFEAIMLTLAFTRMEVRGEKTGRLLAAVAGCSLGIFIWHTMPLMIFGWWGRFGIASDEGMLRIAGTFAVGVLSMYLLSFVWVFICRKLRYYIEKKIVKR